MINILIFSFHHHHRHQVQLQRVIVMMCEQYLGWYDDCELNMRSVAPHSSHHDISSASAPEFSQGENYRPSCHRPRLYF